MFDLLKGIRVVELAQWVMVPSSAALLADLGADVIKIEHPAHGDPYRGLKTAALQDTATGESPLWPTPIGASAAWASTSKAPRGWRF